MVDVFCWADAKGFLMPRYLLLTIVSLGFVLAACGTVTESYRLNSGDTLEGDHHLVAVDVVIEAGSTIEGNLNITAGETVEINGQIQGDLTILTQDLTLGQNARIEGNLIYCLVNQGQYTVDDNATIL